MAVDRRAVVARPVLALLVLLSGCAALPQHDSLPSPTADQLLLVIHGSGSAADRWPADLLRTVRRVEPAASEWDLLAYDWEEEALKMLTAARRGYRIGRELGRSLAAEANGNPTYRVIHIVAHSVGSHVSQGIIDAIRAAQPAGAGPRTELHATFIDPFSARGLVQWRWGARTFGRGADVSDCYISTGDRVPGTNWYLRRAHNFDVTALVPERFREDASSFHWWPVEYYRSSVGSQRPGFRYSRLLSHRAGHDSPAQLPLGVVTVIPATE